MKPSERCKLAGLKSLAELAEMTGESVQTLNNWYKNKPQRFEIVLIGAISKYKKQPEGKAMYTVYIDFENGDKTEQFQTQNAEEAERYASGLAVDHPDEYVFIAAPNGGYLNRDGHSPVGKRW